MPKRFPHSEIYGLTVARHLPVTYRSHATSFIAILSLGIHHTLLNFPLGNLKTTVEKKSPLTFSLHYFVLLHIMNFHTYNVESKQITSCFAFLQSEYETTFTFTFSIYISEKTPNTYVRNS